MDTPLVWWVGFLVLVAVLLAFDLGILHRREREIRVREALLLSLFYVVLSFAFSGVVFWLKGQEAGYQFITGYLIEKTLSLDNIFVFVLVFGHFAVPRLHQHRVLLWGVLGAILMRGVLIGAGVALIARFSVLIYFFGAFLIVTGIKMLVAPGGEPEFEENAVMAFARRFLRVTPGYHGNRFFHREGGKTWVTPLFLVLILIEITDVIFALDSIPAIFAVTDDPFIIFTSNIFAILGLRALYFAIAVIIHRFEYLKYGLALVLLLIGAKMIVNHYYHREVLSTEVSLGATVAIIACSMLVSLRRTRYASVAGNAWPVKLPPDREAP